MKLIVFLLGVVVFGAWALLSYVLLGGIDASWLKLSLPKSTSEFGDSIGILNGLFSALAVVLALIAVLLQGKELKESTKAQNEQTDALKTQLGHQERLNNEQLKRSQTMMEQLEQQQMATRALILQAKQQYHSSEIARMDAILDKIDGNHDKSDLFESCRLKKKGHIKSINTIQVELDKLS
jgi:hypothetical protein